MSVARVLGVEDGEEAVALLLDHAEWVRAAAGVDLAAEQPGFAGELAALAEGRVPWSGALFLARAGSRPVGTAGVRFHDDGSAELKRMYVRPVARGRGVGHELVEAVVDAAEAHGCDRLWLETKRGAMDAAIAVYARHGFAVVPGGPRTLRATDGIVVMARSLAAARCA
jgi:GNAT superfamily N-acetyltransferase